MAHPETVDSHHAQSSAALVAPHPGTPEMPRWDVGELPDAPSFTWRNWALLLGPGLVMGGAAIGGGEWITGPAVTARYGGALMWLATLSILFQVVYNLEISRYTLYTGEPIFTGKFRLLPSPRFWLVTYLLLDFGSFVPYLVASAATPLAAMLLGRIPRAESPELVQFLGIAMTEKTFYFICTYIAFMMAVVPLVFGGKVYNSLRVLMSVKIVYVLIVLSLLAICFTTPAHWKSVGLGLISFGNVPVERGEDANNNGVLDPGEDWDDDGRLDVVEPRHLMSVDTNGDGEPDAWADNNGDGLVNKLDRFRDLDGDGTRDGDNVQNVFVAWFQGHSTLPINLTMIGMLAAMAAISGQGGLTNTAVSGYTRDQGWGMGHHVGCIPSIVGRKQFKLSHVGMVFLVTQASLARFRRWYRHVARDQLVVWMPACFVGIVLPSMLSLAFLKRGTESSGWETPAMTAQGVSDAVTGAWGSESIGALFWYLTLFCGLIILWPSAATTADGVLRRWVDVFWTGSPRLRKLKSDKIAWVYFGVLCAYALVGFISLSFGEPTALILISTSIYNLALGVSFFHTLAINLLLLPKELRPGWFMRVGLVLGGCYFLLLAIVTVLEKMGYFG
jgi:hypothetical protein